MRSFSAIQNTFGIVNKDVILLYQKEWVKDFVTLTKLKYIKA